MNISLAMKKGDARARMEMAESRLADLRAQARHLESRLREAQNSIATSKQRLRAMAGRYGLEWPDEPTPGDLDGLMAAAEAYQSTAVAFAKEQVRQEAERIAARAGFGRMEGGWA
jgi:chromosome segregation ATPase